MQGTPSLASRRPDRAGSEDVEQLITTQRPHVASASSPSSSAATAGSESDPIVVADVAKHADHHETEDRPYDEKLTSPEIDVRELVTEGLSNKFIAERLGISDQPVKFHIASILGKLGAANRTDAVRRALRRGLISL